MTTLPEKFQTFVAPTQWKGWGVWQLSEGREVEQIFSFSTKRRAVKFMHQLAKAVRNDGGRYTPWSSQ